MFYWIFKILMCIPFWIMFPTFSKGKKNLPKGKCIILCNHISNFDAPIVANVLPRRLFFLAKKEVFNGKFNRWFFKNLGVIPVDREKVQISTMKQVMKTLENKKSIIIFPEGTRNKTELPLGPIKSGAAVFAVRGNVPMVPIWINKKPKMFTFNKINIGKPFYITKEQLPEADKIIEENLLNLKK